MQLGEEVPITEALAKKFKLEPWDQGAKAASLQARGCAVGQRRSVGVGVGDIALTNSQTHSEIMCPPCKWAGALRTGSKPTPCTLKWKIKSLSTPRLSSFPRPALPRRWRSVAGPTRWRLTVAHGAALVMCFKATFLANDGYRVYERVEDVKAGLHLVLLDQHKNACNLRDLLNGPLVLRSREESTINTDGLTRVRHACLFPAFARKRATQVPPPSSPCQHLLEENEKIALTGFQFVGVPSEQQVRLLDSSIIMVIRRRTILQFRTTQPR